MKRLFYMTSKSLFIAALSLAVLMMSACTKEAKKDEGGNVPSGPISILTPFLDLTYNQEATLVASVANANETMVFWNIEQEGEPVAQVIESGKNASGFFYAIVKAIGENGSGTVVARPLSDLMQTARCPVSVRTIPVQSVTLNRSQVSLVKSKPAESSVQLEATILPENATNKTLEYTSGNPDIATVSPTGLITAVANGETYVTVATTDGSNIKRAVSVKVVNEIVRPLAFGIDTPGYSTTIPDMVSGDRAQMSIFWFTEETTEREYTVLFDPEGIASASNITSESFTMTALQPGTVQVTLKSPYYTTSPYTLTVTAGQPRVEFDWTGLEEYLDEYGRLLLSYDESPKVRLKANAINSSNKSLTWSVSDGTNVSVNGSGDYWLKNNVYQNGLKALVALQVNPSIKAECPLVIYRKPTSINPSKTSETVAPMAQTKTITFSMMSTETSSQDEVRQRVQYTLSNSIQPYVSVERNDVSVTSTRDALKLTLKSSPSSPVTGTLTVWPLGYASDSKLRATINITVK